MSLGREIIHHKIRALQNRPYRLVPLLPPLLLVKTAPTRKPSQSRKPNATADAENRTSFLPDWRRADARRQRGLRAPPTTSVQIDTVRLGCDPRLINWRRGKHSTPYAPLENWYYLDFYAERRKLWARKHLYREDRPELLVDLKPAPPINSDEFWYDQHREQMTEDKEQWRQMAYESTY